MENMVDKLHGVNSGLKNELDNLKKLLIQRDDEIGKLRKDLDQCMRKLSQLESEFDRARSDFDFKMADSKSVIDGLRNLESSLKSENKALKQELNDTIPKLNREIAQWKRNYEKADQTKNILEGEVSSLNKDK